MKCEDWQELILEREQLELGQQTNLAQHLSSCEDCREWAKALAEMDASLTTQLIADLNPSVLPPRISRAVAREKIWMAGVPDFLEALGWSALWMLTMAGVLLWTNGRGWIGNHLFWAGAGTLAASLAWAGRVLWKDKSETRRLL
jgi:predicted anti-sigma-YlaC factor YlaD